MSDMHRDESCCPYRKRGEITGRTPVSEVSRIHSLACSSRRDIGEETKLFFSLENATSAREDIEPCLGESQSMWSGAVMELKFLINFRYKLANPRKGEKKKSGYHLGKTKTLWLRRSRNTSLTTF